jgi:hypothetical protein
MCENEQRQFLLAFFHSTHHAMPLFSRPKPVGGWVEPVRVRAAPLFDGVLLRVPAPARDMAPLLLPPVAAAGVWGGPVSATPRRCRGALVPPASATPLSVFTTGVVETGLAAPPPLVRVVPVLPLVRESRVLRVFGLLAPEDSTGRVALCTATAAAAAAATAGVPAVETLATMYGRGVRGVAPAKESLRDIADGVRRSPDDVLVAVLRRVTPTNAGAGSTLVRAPPPETPAAAELVRVWCCGRPRGWLD